VRPYDIGVKDLRQGHDRDLITSLRVRVTSSCACCRNSLETTGGASQAPLHRVPRITRKHHRRVGSYTQTSWPLRRKKRAPHPSRRHPNG
jgi:hypothetical protein